jgi:hypothetical protein
MQQITKHKAIETTMRKYPAMDKATATHYVEEVLGYFKD